MPCHISKLLVILAFWQFAQSPFHVLEKLRQLVIAALPGRVDCSRFEYAPRDSDRFSDSADQLEHVACKAKGRDAFETRHRSAESIASRRVKVDFGDEKEVIEEEMHMMARETEETRSGVAYEHVKELK